MKDDLPRLPIRSPAGHKGTFGTVAVVGGSALANPRMVGAPALAALGALRSGVGVVRLVMPGAILDAGLSICPSATGRALPTEDDGSLRLEEAVEVFDKALAGCDAAVIGPGLGAGPMVAALSLRAVQQEDFPVVVDADALNALATTPDLHLDFHARAILTPHPGEFRRLAAAFKISHDPTSESARPDAARALALRLGCIVALKGAGTVVSDGLEVWVCAHQTPCLATGGTGDVLAGLIAGLLAQHSGTLSLYDLARLGVEAHARAGMAWAERANASGGLLATELAESLPKVLESMR